MLLNTWQNVSHKGLAILQKSRQMEGGGGRNPPGSVYFLMIHEPLLPVVTIVTFCTACWREETRRSLFAKVNKLVCEDTESLLQVLLVSFTVLGSAIMLGKFLTVFIEDTFVFVNLHINTALIQRAPVLIFDHTQCLIHFANGLKLDIRYQIYVDIYKVRSLTGCTWCTQHFTTLCRRPSPQIVHRLCESTETQSDG